MVYLRGDTYHYEFKVAGRKLRGTCATKNYNTALRIESIKKTDALKGDYGLKPQKSMPTLKEFGERFLAELNMRHSDQPGTLDFYIYNFQQLCAYKPLGNCDLDQIDEDRINAYSAHCASKHLGKSTTNRRLATLRKAMRFAKRLKCLKDVPFFDLYKEPPPRDYVIDRDEQRRYFDLCPKHLHKLGILALESGMRLGECLGLKWGDVYLEPGGAGSRPYIHCRGKKSRQANRMIPMSRVLFDHLTEMRASSVCDYVLTSVRDNTRKASKDTLEDAHQRLRTKHNFHPKLVIHSFRHTMATRMGEAGVEAFAIQKLLGHSSITMSQRYVHPTAGTLDRAFDLIDASAVGSHKKGSAKASKVESFPRSRVISR